MSATVVSKKKKTIYKSSDKFSLSKCDSVLHLLGKFVRRKKRVTRIEAFSEKTKRVFGATRSIKPILKERDGLFALARILWLRQAKSDNYWLLNSDCAPRQSDRESQRPCQGQLRLATLYAETLRVLIITHSLGLIKISRMRCKIYCNKEDSVELTHIHTTTIFFESLVECLASDINEGQRLRERTRHVSDPAG